MDNKMINNKNSELKILISVVIVIIVGIILASSYAFFNYTRTGNTITLSNGEINFSFTEGNTISKGNAFPITTADIDNTVTKTFSLTGHTTYANGIRYNIYVIYGDNETGKTRLRDDVVSFRFTPPTNANGFTNEVNNCSSPTSLTFTNGKALIASGKIQNTSSLTTKNYTLELWIDSSKMNISSTTKRANNAEGNPSLAVSTTGTTTATRYMRNDTTEASTVTLYPAITSQQGKIIYTTNEFASSFYSFKILIEAYNIVGNS